MPVLINKQKRNTRTTPPRSGKKTTSALAVSGERKRKPGSTSSPQRATKRPPNKKKSINAAAEKKRGADRVHYESSIHLKVLQKEVAKERKKRRELKLPEEAVNLPVSIKQTFFRLSDKNEPIRTGKWLSDLCARSKRSDNNTTHEMLTVLHKMGVDVGRAIFSREQNGKNHQDKKLRDNRQYDKWFMGKYAKLNLWVSQGGGGENDIHSINDLCTDDDLKKFVKKNLKAYDEGNLEQKYVNMLDAMNFPWRPFNESFQILCSYYMENGNMDINEEDNPQLFRFAQTMRKLKAEKKIDKAEEAMLSNIGFPWQVVSVSSKSWKSKKQSCKSRASEKDGSRVISVTSPTGKKIALSSSFASFSGNTCANRSSNIAFDNSPLNRDLDISDESRIKLGNSSSQLMKGGNYFLPFEEDDNASDNSFNYKDKDDESDLTETDICFSSSSSKGEDEDKNKEEEHDESTAMSEEGSKETGGNKRQGKNISYISEEGSGNEGSGNEGDDNEGDDNEGDGNEGGDNEGGDNNDSALIVLQFHPRVGFQSRVCSHCKKEQTRHRCHKQSDKGIMLHHSIRVCGLSTCHDCRLKEDYENTGRCIGCNREEVEEEKKKKAQAQAKAAKPMAKAKYNMEMLEKMNVAEVRKLCTKEGIKFGQKRLPGCLKLLKTHFKLS